MCFAIHTPYTSALSWCWFMIGHLSWAYRIPATFGLVRGSQQNTSRIQIQEVYTPIPCVGLLTFTRVSDGKVLLAESAVRTLVPTTTTPSVPGFLSLQVYCTGPLASAHKSNIRIMCECTVSHSMAVALV